MHFYTNVYQHRNLILVREFKDGEYIQKQVQYKPTFYVIAGTVEKLGIGIGIEIGIGKLFTVVLILTRTT